MNKIACHVWAHGRNKTRILAIYGLVLPFFFEIIEHCCYKLSTLKNQVDLRVKIAQNNLFPGEIEC